MKRLYIKLGLMCDFEDVSQGHIATACILAIGLLVFGLVLTMGVNE